MKLSTIASSTLLAILTLGSMVRAQKPLARALTIDECLKMIHTETVNEFDWEEDPAKKAIAGALWQDSNKFEWQKAYNDELQDIKYPYLLCHVGKDPTTNKNLSGYQRKLALAKAIDYVEGQDYFRPLYNEDDYLCAYGQLLASRAGNVTGEEFIVQPIIPSLKFMSGSVESMQKEIKFAQNSKYNPSLDMVLCPGVAVAEDKDATIEMVTESGWEDIDEDTAQDIIDMLVPKTKTSELASAISETIEMSESYYLTSEKYIQDTQELGGTTNERSKLWKGLIRDYQESGKCDATYSKQLKWTVQKARDPETDVSLLNVEFNTTGNSESDIGCMLTLALAIAAHPNVCSLENRERVNVQNKIIQWLTQSELEDKRPFFDAGLDGSGQVVALSDTGVDQDNCYFRDTNDVRAGSFMNTGNRKIAQYVPYVDTNDQEYGHGTHVAGTILGKRIDGNGMADGVAPGAKLAFADIGDSSGALSLPLDSQLLGTGFPNAKIHSASWGSELNFYTTQARNFDQYMYDNDEFLVVVAAGNSGHGDAPNTVGSPATGKNVIAVGAHHNTGKSNPKHGLGPAYIADFSSRGPTLDQRMKPDLMAPGKAVLSAGAKPNQVGECDPEKNPGANGRSDGVLSLQGTSMATPVVSGTAAIIRQYFQQGYYPHGVKNETVLVPTPSGALIKAVLMNGAQWLKGVDNGGDGVTEIKPYDNNQGFGRLSLQDSVYLPGNTNVQISAFDRAEVFDGGTEVETIKIDKSDGCTYENLSVTLVWVERGSTPGCTACVLNDLDLTVELGGRTYYPNGLGGPDRHNSAERVIIQGVNDGDVATIRVAGYNLMERSQRYSLVATGCFGGVANENFKDVCSAFDCDESKDERMQTILMAIFIPLGVILLCVCGIFIKRRRDSSQAQENYDTYE